MAARNMTTGPAIPLARFSAQARLRALQADILELILERDLVPGDPLPTEYKVVEISTVTDEEIQKAGDKWMKEFKAKMEKSPAAA